jgi:hypothetical protein
MIQQHANHVGQKNHLGCWRGQVGQDIGVQQVLYRGGRLPLTAVVPAPDRRAALHVLRQDRQSLRLGAHGGGVLHRDVQQGPDGGDVEHGGAGNHPADSVEVGVAVGVEQHDNWDLVSGTGRAATGTRPALSGNR